MQTIEFSTTALLAGKRLDAALAGLFPEWSRARIQGWIESERVQVNSRPVANRFRLDARQHISLSPEFPAVIEDQAESISLDIVWEDEHLLVVNKPAGLVVHPGAGNARGTLLNALLGYAQVCQNFHGLVWCIGWIRTPAV